MDPIKVDFSGKGTPKEIVIPPDKKVLKLVISIIITLIGGAITYYFMLPALNFKAIELYYFIGIVAAIYLVATAVVTKAIAKPEYIPYVKKQAKIPLIIVLAFVVVLVIGYLVSAPLFRANAYSDIIKVEDTEFGEGKSITEITDIKDFSSVPMIDKDAAFVLANKQLGDLPTVSQFVIDSTHSTQINYDGNPYRIFPLKYGDVFKWMLNTKDGIPAYVAVNMYTQEADVVILEDKDLSNIQVSTGEYLNERLDRVLRFKFPTYMFGTPSLEIDDEGNPFWVCERVDKTIGLLGGTDVIGVVLVNACDKTDIREYTIDEVINNSAKDKDGNPIDLLWIDQIYSEDLLVEQFNYYGKYQDGFINSYIGQVNVKTTTVGSSCIASNGDVWLYTGVTSVTNDDSIIGFAIINQRTKEAVFQNIAGTTESGAQTSAQGIVSDKGWTATFPILLNLDGEATYFMSLKDNDVVKSYAMVSVERVQDAVRSANDAKPDLADCLEAYIDTVKTSTGRTLNVNYDKNAQKPSADNKDDGAAAPEEEKTETITGVITDIRTAVMDGNSTYFVALDDGDVYYSISASKAENVVILNVGDTVTVTYKPEEAKILDANSIK